MKITDFGIAHLEDPCSTFQTQDGIILGTPAYMSPEQILGKHVDGRSDIFSLGTVLYELGSGKRPFGREGQNLATLFNEIVHIDPSVPAHINHNIPDNLSQIIMRCLNKKPDDRFQTGKDLAEALKSHIQESKFPAPSVKSESFSIKKPRHFVYFLLITILLISIIGGFIGGFYGFYVRQRIEDKIKAQEEEPLLPVPVSTTGSKPATDAELLALFRALRDKCIPILNRQWDPNDDTDKAASKDFTDAVKQVTAAYKARLDSPDDPNDNLAVQNAFQHVIEMANKYCCGWDPNRLESELVESNNQDTGE